MLNKKLDNIYFFFSSRRRHTRWPRDWSSDVCSSDLELEPRRDAAEKLDERVVEERRAQLEAGRHARAIGVHQVLPGEVVLAVPVDQPCRRVVRPARREDGIDVPVRIESS